MTEENSTLGNRTVAHLQRLNKYTVQRISQLKGWQLGKRAVGFRPGAKPRSSRWRSPMNAGLRMSVRSWPVGMLGDLVLVSDCFSWELLGWKRSRSGKAKTAASALERALIKRFERRGEVETPILLVSDNRLLVNCRSYTALIYGQQQDASRPIRRSRRSG